LWLKNPGWLPGDKGLADANERAKHVVYTKYEAHASKGAVAYISLQFLGILAGTFAVMVLGTEMPTVVLAWLYPAAISGMLLWAPLLGGKPWAPKLEVARSFAVLGGGALIATQVAAPPWVVGGAGAYLALSCVA